MLITRVTNINFGNLGLSYRDRKEFIMTEKLELYKCNVCGNIAQIILNGEGELVCCGEVMHRLDANTEENVNTEYHVPVFNKNEDGSLTIQVGKEQHPMTEEHFIEFIEAISADKNTMTLRYLYPNEEPVFTMKGCEPHCAKAYCNIHGLWKGENGND